LSSADIDWTDPRVQEILHGSPLASGKPRSRDVVQLAGDIDPDPDRRGLVRTIPLTSGKREVVVVYAGSGGEMFLTIDVYQVSGEPPQVHLYCPRCQKHSIVSGQRKRIEFDPSAPNPLGAAIRSAGNPDLALHGQFGRISIETFECTWEIGDARHAPGAVHTGASLCRLRLVIEDNRAREA
jgi:hypothetical protein